MLVYSEEEFAITEERSPRLNLFHCCKGDTENIFNGVSQHSESHRTPVLSLTSGTTVQE